MRRRTRTHLSGRSRKRFEKEVSEFGTTSSTFKIGDGLRTSIDRGLAESSFGLVILSPSFFGKKWTNRELDGLVSREIAEGRNLILPVWYHTSFEEVARYSPTLANTVALK